MYYSALPEGSTLHETPIPPKTDRAQTIIGAQRMYRRPEDGKLICEMLMQCDVKIKVTPKLIAMFLPSGMQDWNAKLNKFLNDNYDNI